jgi:hypothetical protein
MTKSENTSAFRVIRIDDALRHDHPYLTAEDECFCLGEYQPRAGFNAGPVNNLISNYKKSVDKRGRPEYIHKERAIMTVASLVQGVFNENAIKTCTVVPIPPSKAKTDALYDDRLVRSLRAVHADLDFRELLVTKESMRAHHEFQVGEKRPTPDDLYVKLAIDEASLQTPVKQTIILFDDVLTNGTHFKACKRLLNERLPKCSVVGLFIGRAKRPDVLADFDIINDL